MKTKTLDQRKFKHKFTKFKEVEQRDCLHCNNYLGCGSYKIKDLPGNRVLWGTMVYCKVEECQPDFSGRCKICHNKLYRQFEKKAGICWLCSEKKERAEKTLETKKAMRKLLEAVKQFPNLGEYKGQELLNLFKKYTFVFKAWKGKRGEMVVTVLQDLPMVLRKYMKSGKNIYRAKCDTKLCKRFKSCVACVVEQALKQISAYI